MWSTSVHTRFDALMKTCANVTLLDQELLKIPGICHAYAPRIEKPMAAEIIIRKFRLLILPALIITLLIVQNDAIAAQLQLTWLDNSNNEIGFKIERSTGTGA